MKTSKARVLRTVAALCLLLIAARPAAAGHYTWTTRGPEPGTIYQIVVDPQDSNRIYTYAGYYGSILFQTSDRGADWFQNEGLVIATELRAHPTDGNILYAVGSSGTGGGVFRSLDGGRSWLSANVGLSGYVYPIALSPSSPNVLYAVSSGTPGKFFRSDDAAVSWTMSASFPSDYVGDLAVDPQNAAVVYAVAGTSILKSVDSGATWSPGGAIPYPACVRVDPASPSTLWAGTNADGVYKSPDGGATWVPANQGVATAYIRDIALDPTNSLKAFAAGEGGVFVTVDGGQLWTPVDVGVALGAGTAVTIDPRDPSLVYAAGSASSLRGGLFRSEDGGQNWTPVQRGLSGYFSYAVAPHPAVAGTARAVSGASVFESTPETGWTLRGTAPYALTQLIADPSNGDVLYAGFVTPEPGGDGVLRSPDGGAGWVPATNGLSVSMIHRLSIARSAPTSLLAATFDGLFGTTDSGGLWSPLHAGDVRAAAIDVGDARILYAGFFALANEDGLLRSDDGGASWSAPAGLPTGNLRVSDIATAPGAPSAVYVAGGFAGIFRSVDRGLSFSPTGTGLPPGQSPYRFASDPVDGRTLYLATSSLAAATADTSAFANVFRSTDGADTWAPLPGFLPVWTPLDFQVNADGRRLYASTLSGVFQFERSFLDLPDGDLFWASVDAAAMNRVTAGCGGGLFCPRAATSRASIAAFLLRGKHGAAYEPPAASGSVFSDVPADSLAAAFIEELFHEGITAGCEADAFCPAAPVSRAQLAVLLLKAKHGPDYVPPAATGTVFADVPADAFAAAWIERLFAEGISAGCGGARFCPDDSASRAQAAAFVVRAFGLS